MQQRLRSHRPADGLRPGLHQRHRSTAKASKRTDAPRRKPSNGTSCAAVRARSASRPPSRASTAWRWFPHLICGGLVEIRHRGHADRHGFPGAAQRAGAARRQVGRTNPASCPYAQGHAHAADLVRQIAGHEPRRIHRRRGRGVPPLEVLGRRGGLSRKAFRGGERPKATSSTSRRRSMREPTTS